MTLTADQDAKNAAFQATLATYLEAHSDHVRATAAYAAYADAKAPLDAARANLTKALVAHEAAARAARDAGLSISLSPKTERTLAVRDAKAAMAKNLYSPPGDPTPQGVLLDAYRAYCATTEAARATSKAVVKAAYAECNAVRAASEEVYLAALSAAATVYLDATTKKN